MSARNQHLQWVDPETFQPGLWTTDGAITMPATAAQQMDNCHPTVAGGLRAALKVSATTTNSGLPTDGTVSGYYVRVDIGALGLDRYLFIARPGGLSLYRHQPGDGSWALRKAHVAGSAGGAVAETFVDSAGTVFVTYGLAAPVSDRGVWTYNTTSHASAKVRDGACQLVAVQGARIIADKPSSGSAFGNTITWTESQSSTNWNTAQNFQPINVSKTNTGMRVIFASWPSDLLLGFGDSPWVTVQGDITQPLVRSMADTHLAGSTQKMLFTDKGLAFLGWDTVYVTSDGSSFEDMAQQINADDQLGQMVYSNKNLYVPGGDVFDFESESWFHVTGLENYTRGDSTTGGAGSAAFAMESGGVITLADYYSLGDTRQSTYTWKGAPLRSQDGREIVIREVQIFATSHDSNATLAVTVAGETHTVTIASASTQQHSFRFLAGRGEVVDVKVVSTAGLAANEAPTLEKPPRMGIAPGHLLTP